VRPRPSSLCERSSAPSMKAARSRRLSSLDRLSLPVGCRGRWFTAPFSPGVARTTSELGPPSVEPNGDPTPAEDGDEVPRARLLEAASEVGHVSRQGRHGDRSTTAALLREQVLVVPNDEDLEVVGLHYLKDAHADDAVGVAVLGGHDDVR